MIFIGPRSTLMTLSWSSQLTSGYQFHGSFGTLAASTATKASIQLGGRFRGIVGIGGYWCADAPAPLDWNANQVTKARHFDCLNFLRVVLSCLSFFGFCHERRGLVDGAWHMVHNSYTWKNDIYSTSKMKHIVHTSGHCSWFTNVTSQETNIGFPPWDRRLSSTLQTKAPEHHHWVPDPNDPTLDFSLLYDWRDLP